MLASPVLFYPMLYISFVILHYGPCCDVMLCNVVYYYVMLFAGVYCNSLLSIAVSYNVMLFGNLVTSFKVPAEVLYFLLILSVLSNRYNVKVWCRVLFPTSRCCLVVLFSAGMACGGV